MIWSSIYFRSPVSKTSFIVLTSRNVMYTHHLLMKHSINSMGILNSNQWKKLKKFQMNYHQSEWNAILLIIKSVSNINNPDLDQQSTIIIKIHSPKLSSFFSPHLSDFLPNQHTSLNTLKITKSIQ